MNDLVDVLKMILPALVVTGFAIFYLRAYFEQESDKRNHETKAAKRKLSTPIRLQAYERLALFLERINLVNLLRNAPSKIDSIELMKFYLINQINQEFDHNISQQVYVSDKLWNLIVTAKNASIIVVNQTVSDLEEGSTLNDFKKVLITDNSGEENPQKYALNYLKQEIRLEF